MKWLLYGLLLFAPLPLASARPTWQWLWVVYVGIACIVFLLTHWRSRFPNLPSALRIVTILTLVFIGWGFVQALAPIGLEASIAMSAVDDILQDLATISVAPYHTLSNTLYYLAHAAFFYLVYATVSRRIKAAEFIRFAGISGGLYAAYGFIVFVSGNDTILWYEKWAGLGSLTSTFVNRNSFAAFVGLGLQCLIAYAYFWTQDELAEGRKGRELLRHFLDTILTKAWWLPLAIILAAIALLLTNSRGGFGSVVIGMICLLLLSPNRYQREHSIWRTFVVYVFFALVGVLLFSLSGSVLEGRLQNDASFDQRFVVYPIILDAIMDRPILGFGLGTFDEVFRIFRTEDVTIYFDRAHNDYLELAITAGIPAMAIFLSAFMIVLVYLARRLRFGAQYRSFIALGISTSVQLGVHSLVDFSLQMPAVSYLWAAILAASVAVAHRSEQSQSRQ